MVGIRRFSTRKEAERAEAVVAKVLEKRGHRVFWGWAGRVAGRSRCTPRGTLELTGPGSSAESDLASA